MRSIHSLRRVQFTAVLSLTAFASLPLCAGADQYSILNLGHLPGGTNCTVTGLNNLGEVVGHQTTPTGQRAFLYQNGGLTNLGLLPGNIDEPSQGSYAYASSINNSSVVAAYGSKPGPSSYSAFLWQNGVITDMQPAGTLQAGAYINDNGVALVHQYTFPANMAYYQNGSLTDIAGTADLGPAGINLSNQVIGNFNDGITLKAFFYDGATVAQLPPLAGSSSAQVRGINNSGQTIGDSDFRAVIWENGVATDLGFLPGATYASGRGINNQGKAVGYSYAIGTENAFYWNGSSMLNLNSMVNNLSGWANIRPRGINDNGQIAGDGYFNGVQSGFLLTPIAAATPEPGSVGLIIGLGMVGGICVRRRRARQA